MSQDSKVPDSQWSPHRFAVQLVAVTILINLFVIGLAGWALQESWRQYEERAATTTQNLALVLGRYIFDAIDKIDVTLVALADETERQLANGAIDAKWLNMRIARQKDRLLELDSLRIADEKGDIVYGTGPISGKLANVAGRDYFIRLRDDPKAGLVISKPVIGAISKQWVIMLARRLNKPDGSFAGTVYGVIALDHFGSVFSTLNVGKNGSIALCDSDMRVVVRVPGTLRPESYVGKKLESYELDKILRARRDTGTFQDVSPLDHLKRIYSFRKLEEHALYIFVGRESADYLAPWKSEAADLLGVVTCFSVVSIVSAYQIYKRLKREKQAEADLALAMAETHKETVRRLAAVEELRSKEQLLIQQSRLAAMGEMMGNIAHQWRQPLNLLGLIVQELNISYKKGFFSQQLLDGQVAKAMEVIQHMSRTIDDFRNLLSPDRSQVTFSINELVEKVLSIMQPKAKVEVSAEDECFAEGTRNEYSQVIINIIANAHDVFRERQIRDPRIAIRIFRENDRSVVTIADNGGGIPAEIIGKIFDPYFTTKGPDQGTGIGLFMSKTIIERSMKGALTVRNTEVGAEFRIEV